MKLKELNIDLIGKDEIIKAIQKIKNWKSGGIDVITTEILQAGLLTRMQCLEKHFTSICTMKLYHLNVTKEWL